MHSKIISHLVPSDFKGLCTFSEKKTTFRWHLYLLWCISNGWKKCTETEIDNIFNARPETTKDNDTRYITSYFYAPTLNLIVFYGWIRHFVKLVVLGILNKDANGSGRKWNTFIYFKMDQDISKKWNDRKKDWRHLVYCPSKKL